jgi:SAM-dependent methyltransferase
MFFADPIAAFANLHRALRPGGRLLCAAWRPLVDNLWATVPLEAARALLPPQTPADQYAPGPFALADPDHTRGVLAAAGWHDAMLTRRDVPMRLTESGQVEQAADFATRIGVLARMLADQNPDVVARVRQAVAETLRSYDSAAGIALTGSIWLISARA